MINVLWQDLRYGWRGLWRTPTFAVVAVITLALGIGANTTIFSVIEGVLLRSLPYQDPDRIVTIWELGDAGGAIHVSAPNFRDWQEQVRSFDAMAMHSSPDFGGRMTVLGGREAMRVRVTAISPEFSRVFGVQPALGRAFGRRIHVRRGCGRGHPWVLEESARWQSGPESTQGERLRSNPAGHWRHAASIRLPERD